MNHSKKKSWKGYLLDFIMLFLAVSLGFMADNFREGASDRSKEIEYIRSMIEDVEEDRVNIKAAIDVNTQKIQGLDSLLNICFNYRDTDADKLDINRHFIQVLYHPEFLTPTDLTMQQLKNAGGMRLIKSKTAINDIIRYDTKLKKITNQQLYYENYQNKAIDRGTEIFNIHNLLFALRNPDERMSPNYYELLDKDDLKLKEFGNSIAMYKGIIEYYVRLLSEMNEQGDVLMETLKSEYKLN